MVTLPFPMLCSLSTMCSLLINHQNICILSFLFRDWLDGNILGLQVIRSLSQPLNSATMVQKQPKMICKLMNVAVFQ